MAGRAEIEMRSATREGVAAAVPQPVDSGSRELLQPGRNLPAIHTFQTMQARCPGFHGLRIPPTRRQELGVEFVNVVDEPFETEVAGNKVAAILGNLESLCRFSQVLQKGC